MAFEAGAAERKRKRFSKEAKEKLGYYIYALSDCYKMGGKEIQKIFYIGQASHNNRVFKHEENAHKGKASPKKEKIMEIQEKKGHCVKAYIILHGLQKEQMDIAEAAFIKMGKLVDPRIKLTNKIQGKGHKKCWLEAKELLENPEIVD